MFFSHFPLEIPSSTGSLVLGKSRPESVGTSFRAAPGLLRTAFKQQLVSWDTSQVCVRPEMFLGCFWRTQRRTAWQRHNGQTWFLVSAGVFSSLRKWSIRNPFFVAKLRAEGIRIHWLGPTARSLYFQIFWGLEHVLLAMFHHHDFRGKSVVNPHWWFYQLWSAMARPQEFSSHGWWPWRVCTWRPVSSGVLGPGFRAPRSLWNRPAQQDTSQRRTAWAANAALRGAIRVKVPWFQHVSTLLGGFWHRNSREFVGVHPPNKW